MRDVLRSSMLGRSLRTLSVEDRLTMAWPVVAGSAIAARSAVVGFEDGRALIQVANAAWRDELEAARGRLIGELARISGVGVRDIRWQVG